MADLVISHFNEFIAAASADPDSDGQVDRANEISPYAPNGVYVTSDGWIAITVRQDHQYQRLVDALGLARSAVVSMRPRALDLNGGTLLTS